MGTLSVSAAGFSALPALPPANWPAGVVYPASSSPNGTLTVTVSDADFLKLITWGAGAQIPVTTPPQAPTAGQILVAIIHNWHQGLINAVQQYHTTPAVVPPPITIA